MSAADAIGDAQITADLMLREPKTLAGSASVADVRAVLENPKVQLVLLADADVFRGAVTHIPDDAAADAPALAYADPDPETIAPTEPALTAFERADASPQRRVIVLDDDGALLGLVCLNKNRTGFCRA
ncbi:MAG: CBS domain-containing protein [Actinomycetota bacterium]